MSTPKSPYPPEFRARVVELARAGRTLRSLAREFGASDTTIRAWLRQADLDEGHRQDGLTTTEKQELAVLRRENTRLREERDILIWNDTSISTTCVPPFGSGANQAAAEAAVATVDHSDIRGSMPHGRDPSGAASY